MLVDIPSFTLCYTTVRGHEIRGVVNQWMERADHPEQISWSVTTDIDKDAVVAEAQDVVSSLLVRGINACFSAVTSLPGDCVKGWNQAANLGLGFSRSTLDKIGDVMIAVADDFSPPQHWDTLLTAAGPQSWWLSDRVVHVSDGYNPDIFTLVILTKTRYSRFGYLFYPGYSSMFSDTEFTAVATADGAVIDATDLLFEHLHPDCGKRQRDAADVVHSSSSRYASGEMLFNLRKSMGFPVDVGPRVDDSTVKAADMAVYVQAIKDDICLYETCERLYEEGARVFFFAIPDEYWSGDLVTSDETGQVTRCGERIKAYLPHSEVHVKTFNVGPYRKPGRSRIQIETDVRNESVAWIRSMGHSHIVIADGDELWRRGLLNQLVDVVNDMKPQCVYTGMVPVVGLPGYPIDGAIDKASIYIGPDTTFQDCRGTFGTKYELRGHHIFHLTAVRRSMAEIVKKSLDSGHFGDANYDFEGWIKNVLPNLRPGYRNCHMYKPYNPWPLMRRWRKDEVDEIPGSLHKYLAVGDLELAVSGYGASPHVSKSFTSTGVPKAN